MINDHWVAAGRQEVCGRGSGGDHGRACPLMKTMKCAEHEGQLEVDYRNPVAKEKNSMCRSKKVKLTAHT